MSDYILEMKNMRKEFLGGKIIANDDITIKIKKPTFIALATKMKWFLAINTGWCTAF